jgi:hypothetical protein
LSLYFDYSSKLGEFVFKIVDDTFDKNNFFKKYPNYVLKGDDSYSLWIRPIEFFTMEDNIRNQIEVLKYPKRYDKFKNLI